MSKEGDKKRTFHKTSSFGPVINRHIDSLIDHSKQVEKQRYRVGVERTNLHFPVL